MNLSCKVFLALFICLTVAGCATPQVSELEKPLGDPYIFVFSDESKVFNIAYHALAREVDQSLIKELNGPVRGFYARNDTWGGNTNYWIRIFAANGVNSQGRNTYGYYGEVMVEGDKGKEADAARKIFGDMEAMFAQQGQKVYVRNLTRAKYRGESIGDYRGGAGYDFDSAPRQAPRGIVDDTVKVPSAPLPAPALAEPARGEYVPQPQARPQRPTPGAQQGAPAAAPYAAPSGAGMADELQKLNELRKQGILTDEEFQRAKERVLGW